MRHDMSERNSSVASPALEVLLSSFFLAILPSDSVFYMLCVRCSLFLHGVLIQYIPCMHTLSGSYILGMVCPSLGSVEEAPYLPTCDHRNGGDPC